MFGYTVKIHTLICISMAGTDLQVMPNFGYPVQIWDSAVRNTIHHHVEFRIEEADHVHKRIDEHHEHGLKGPATDRKQCMYEKEGAPFLYKPGSVWCSVVEY